MGCILSFDVGTTGLKTIVISQEGRILKHCNIEYGIVQEPVSYTHLDVYKRQALLCLLSGQSFFKKYFQLGMDLTPILTVPRPFLRDIHHC